MNVTAEIKAAINLFVERVQAMYDAKYAATYALLMSPRIEVEYGNKFAKVTTTQRDDRRGDGQKSVYCFIDLSNGDLLKAEGWKKPAKGKRGSILNENSDVGTVATVHGGGFYVRR